ncbi:MAG: gliding motility-associated C-terminal domain-containing protein [Flavobacteriales bacterium]|nr:gliding motility-associated C-terminal domain-containing protein [Flavobacteriales bacterium]
MNTKAQCIFAFTAWLLCTTAFTTNGQNTSSPDRTDSPAAHPRAWTVTDPFSAEVFIENNGQFDQPDGQPLKDVRFAINNQGLKVYFTPSGFSYHVINIVPKPRYNSPEERHEILEEVEHHIRKHGKVDASLSRFFDDKSAYVHIEWVNANPEAKVEVTGMVPDNYSYSVPRQEAANKSVIARAYQKLVYRNIYPHIDVEFYFPAKNSSKELGVKYNVIVHPGGDLSRVKMKYSGMESIAVDEQGNIIAHIADGKITDHAPDLAYVDHKGQPVRASFKLDGTTVSFKVPDYDKTKKLVIDPFTSVWSISPGFTTANDGYTIRLDFNHNVYVMGGGVSNGGFVPSYNYQVKKFNTAGVLQWTATGLASTNLGAYGDMIVLRGGKVIVGMGIGAGNTGYILATANGAITTRNVPNVNEFGWRLYYNQVVDNGVLWAGGGSNNGSHLIRTDTSLTTGTIYCPWGTAGNTEDICYLTQDKASQFVYITNSTNSNPNSSATAPKFCKSSVATPGTAIWKVNEPTNMMELGQGSFINGGAAGFAGGWSTGVNGMVICNDRIYTYNGNDLRAYDPATGNMITSVTVGGTLDKFSGLDVDSCCRVYVGLNGVVKRYSSNLVFDASFPVTNSVYDLKFDPLDDDYLYVTGKGFVQKLLRNTCPTCIDTASTPVQGCVLGTGTVTVTDPSGTQPYTYLWSNGKTTQTITGLDPGQYIVTVTDSDPVCPLQWIDTVIVNGVYIPCGPRVTLTATPDTICLGFCTDLEATTTDGTEPYTYAWNPNIGTGGGPHNVCPATTTRYYVTVTDNDGNSDTASVLVVVHDPPSLVTSTIPPTCDGLCDGTGTVTSTGNGPFTYQWDDANSQNTSSATGLCVGTYHVTVTDSFGCTDSTSVTLTSPPAMTLTTDSTDQSCFGTCDGATTVTASGGSSPYQYQWNDGSSQATATATGLCSGSYDVTVTDANGCTAITSVSVNEPLRITSSMDSTDTDCGSATGTGTVTASGGTGNFTYVWSDPSSQTTATATGLGIGTYTVTIMDANGCIATDEVSIKELGGFPVTITKTDVVCNGACDGTATVTPDGGNPPHTFLWSTGTGNQTTQTATGLCPGTYNVTVTDASGCSGSGTVTITEPPLLHITETHTPVSCNGMNDGSIDISISGGSPPVSVMWDQGSTSEDLSNLGAGTYCVTITDANGCTDSLCVLITEPAAILLDTSTIKTSCNICNGSATVSVTGGGTTPFSYMWDDGNSQTSATATGLCAGNYNVTVTDGSGCSAEIPAQVMIHDSPVACFADSTTGCAPLSASFVNCSTGGSTYFWDMGDGTTSDLPDPGHIYNSAGCYDISLTVTSQEGCSATLTKSCYVSAHPVPKADFDASPWTTTILSPTVNFIDKSSNASAWFWDFGDGVTDTTQNPEHTYSDTGCYNVRLILINQFDCTDTMERIVCVKDIYSFYLPNAFSPNNDGVNETFTPVYYGICEFEMYIFDRWGNMIHRTNSLKGWDGKVEGGSDEIAQEDVYVWLVRAIDCNGKTINRTGHVTLLK